MLKPINDGVDRGSNPRTSTINTFLLRVLMLGVIWESIHVRETVELSGASTVIARNKTNAEGNFALAA